MIVKVEDNIINLDNFIYAKADGEDSLILMKEHQVIRVNINISSLMLKLENK